MAINLGERIAQLRKNSSFTQEQLADKLGITSQAISKWETGVTSPDISLLPQLAQIFYISVDELLGIDKKTVMTGQHEDLSKLMFKLRVLSTDGDKVNITLPFAIATKALEVNSDLFKVGDTAKNDVLKNVDWKQFVEAVRIGLRGKIVDVQSADGDIVEIIVEP